MRLLAVSDLHYRLRHYDWLLYAADDVDVVSMAGDLADVANPVPLEVQVVVLDSCLERPSDGAVVLAASGNHDLDAPGPDGEQVAGWLRRPRADAVVTDGRGRDVDGARFTVAPRWDGPLLDQHLTFGHPRQPQLRAKRHQVAHPAAVRSRASRLVRVTAVWTRRRRASREAGALTGQRRASRLGTRTCPARRGSPGCQRRWGSWLLGAGRFSARWPRGSWRCRC